MTAFSPRPSSLSVCRRIPMVGTPNTASSSWFDPPVARIFDKFGVFPASNKVAQSHQQVRTRGVVDQHLQRVRRQLVKLPLEHFNFRVVRDRDRSQERRGAATLGIVARQRRSNGFIVHA